MGGGVPLWISLHPHYNRHQLELQTHRSGGGGGGQYSENLLPLEISTPQWAPSVLCISVGFKKELE